MFNAFLKLFYGSLAGKLVGLLREIIIAAFYGTSTPVGAFRMAQTATLIPVNFFTSDSLNAGFIPLYNRYRKESVEKAQSLFWLLKLILGFISIGLSIGLFVSASWWIGIIAPGFNSEGLEMASLFVKIMAIGIPFYVLSLLYSFLAMANQRYFLTSVRPSVQSAGMICGVMLAYYLDSIAMFAWGFTGAYILFFFIGVTELLKSSLFQFSLFSKTLILKDFWKVIRPLLILPILLQGNIMIEKMVASYIGIEVVAAVDYAKFITETGIVLLAVPLGFVGLSRLSALNVHEMKIKLSEIVPIVLILTIPTSLFLVVNAELIISLVFKRGAFSQESVQLTRDVLIGLAIGFWAQVVSYMLIKALNAHTRNKEVVIYMSIALIANALFNIVLYEKLGAAVIGVGASINAFILFMLSIRSFGITRRILPVFIWLFIASFVYFFIDGLITIDGWSGIFFSLFLFATYWLSCIFVIPVLRSSIMPLVKRFRRAI